MNVHLPLVGALLLLVCIASLNALPIASDDEAKPEANGVAKRQWKSQSPGVPQSIKAVGFNCNIVKGTNSGNFDITNAKTIDALGFNHNNAKGDTSGQFLLGRK